MKAIYTPLFLKLVCFLFIVSTCLIHAQEEDSEIIAAYEDYTEAPREIAYVHLNKSTYIKNEMLGFKAYLFDKSNKSLSTATTNLYCTISDSTNTVIKKKLVKVNKGVSSNIFNIDSLFTSGRYTFRAYTNWMLNFEEPNYFEQQFFVIDSDIETEARTTKRDTLYTIQVLPEGGHLLADVKNTLGIIVKNKHGIGLANANGKIVDQNNTTITEFKLNRFGITRALIRPKTADSYRVIVFNDTEKISTTIDPAEAMGINMSLNTLEDNLFLSLRTNDATSEELKTKDYKLTIHNGSDILELSFNFETNNEINKAINTESLSPGINIFTIFDDQNRPILERLYFNYKNIVQTSSKLISTNKVQDSLALKLKLLTAIDSTKFNAVSISVLPSDTKSYNFNSTILSKLYLEPYVKGFIQNPSYYFKTRTTETQYDLDNLLLTQGWSSYDWNNIFNQPPSYNNAFENGINTVVNINGKNKQGTYITNALKHKKSEIFTITEKDSAFYQKGLFPEETESYKIYKTNNTQNATSQLYIQYMPSSIPLLNINISKPNDTFIGMDFKPLQNFSTITPSWDNTGLQVLDEVVLTAEQKEKTRMQKIKANTFGNVNFIDDETRNTAVTLEVYLNKFGYRTTQERGNLQIFDRRTDKAPVIILDGTVLGMSQVNVGTSANPIFIKDLSPLTASYPMTYIDYIEMNKNGLGADRLAVSMNDERGGAGYIKIVTDPFRFTSGKNSNIASLSEHKFPLTFSSTKKFYVPRYNNYNSTFFKEYGTIAWLADLKPDQNGMLDITFYNTYTSSVNLYIEGVLNDGTLISEVKTIELNN